MSISYVLLRTSQQLRRRAYAPSTRSRPRRADRGVDNSGGASTLVRLPTVAEVVDVGRLLRVFRERRSWAGPAAGVDGLTWDDIGAAEAAEVFRAVSRAALRGAYVPRREAARTSPGRAARPARSTSAPSWTARSRRPSPG